MLKGKKTYILGVLLVLAGVLKDFDQQMILEGLAFITLRMGVANGK